MERLMQYLDNAHSVYHAVALLAEELEQAGYTRLAETEAWELVPGGKYYMVRGGTALMAFRVPKTAPKGFLMAAAHSDRPTFKVKENGELTGSYTRLSVERYGGMIIAPWLDRPLSLAGRVLVETEKGVTARLVDIDRDLMLIPNAAIHVNRTINDGYKWDLTRDVMPLLGGKDTAGKLEAMLEEAAGGKILGRDLFLYVRDKAKVWGVDEEYISAPALDDLAAVWCCAQGLLQARENESVSMLCIFDNEEVGSSSSQGADSTLLDTVISRICQSLQLDKSRMLAQSMLVSADNAHGLHPNHPEFADAQNAPVLGGGVTVKFASTLRYTSDGLSSALLRKVFGEVKTQTYYNRPDVPGGGTLGCIALNHVSVPCVDIGLPQLAMHSTYETCAVADVKDLCAGMTAYYGSTLIVGADGAYSWE